jgi:hypothetical protein
VVRRAAALALLLAGCAEGEPTGFGVNLTVDTTQVRDRVVTFAVHVTGAETFDTELDVSEPVKSGEVRFRYVPGVEAGTLFFAIDGLDAARAVVGRGASAGVALVAGTPATASITLSVGNGEPCMTDNQCPSGFCTDGVCCDSRCDGVCEACNLGGNAGKCAAVPDNTDPATECVAANQLVTPELDGGTFELPDGATVDPTPCAGVCNGSRACRYPPPASCGTAACTSDTQTATFACNGMGSCAAMLTTCVNFICGGNACKTNCAANSDCQADAFCNSLGSCQPKKANGLSCMAAFECQSDVCAQGFCCNSQCDAPNACNTAGKEGQCQCPGVTCPAGVACQLFYKDGDGDGYGDANGTVNNGGAKAGCAGSPPPGFPRATKTDCDDGDARAKPGQTMFFTSQRMTVGGYDFDCDGTQEKETVRAGATCGFCSIGFPTTSCTKRSTCGTSGTQSYLSCGFVKTCICCGTVDEGFIADSACGTSVSSNYRICGRCSANGGAPSVTTTTRLMGCH